MRNFNFAHVCVARHVREVSRVKRILSALATMSGSPRDWMFTLFVDDNEDELALFCCPREAFDPDHPAFKYAVWQIERAPTTGRLHVQGFLQLRKQMGMARVKEVGPCMDPRLR